MGLNRAHWQRTTGAWCRNIHHFMLWVHRDAPENHVLFSIQFIMSRDGLNFQPQIELAHGSGSIGTCNATLCCIYLTRPCNLIWESNCLHLLKKNWPTKRYSRGRMKSIKRVEGAGEEGRRIEKFCFSHASANIFTSFLSSTHTKSFIFSSS